MASKRMFSKKITESRKFRKMSENARLLYFLLGMSADDDGFVDCYDVCALQKIDESVVEELAYNRYLCILNNDGFGWLSCWNENNTIQSDRYHASPYHGLLDDLRALYPVEDLFPTQDEANIVQLNFHQSGMDT